MKMGKMQRLAHHATIAAGVFGAVLMILGFAFQFMILDKIRDEIVKKEMQMNKGSLFYEYWSLPLDSFLNVYLYNVTNVNEVMEHGATPKLREIGPYVYKHVFHHDNISFTDDDTVQFINRYHVEFLPHLSNGLDDTSDIVTVVDITLMGMVNFADDLAGEQISRISRILTKIFPNRTSPFVTATVNEMLFSGITLDCSDLNYMTFAVCRFLTQKAPHVFWMDENRVFKYALLREKNSSSSDVYSLHRGILNIRDRGFLKSINNASVLSHWGSPQCNMLNGSVDSLFFQPYLDKTEKTYYYEPILGRSVHAGYVGNVDFNGVKCLRYELQHELFADTPDNYCFCPTSLIEDDEGQVETTCPPDGFFNLARYMMAPVYASNVYFAYSNESMDDMLLNSDRLTIQDTVTYVDVHPLLGLILSGRKRLQLSIPLRRIPSLDFCKNIPERIVPAIWAEISYDIPPDDLARLLKVLHHLESGSVIGYAMIGVGSVLILVASSLLFYMKKTSVSRVSSENTLNEDTKVSSTINNDQPPQITVMFPEGEMAEKDNVNREFSPYAISYQQHFCSSEDS